jgi:AbiA family abortive infection protein
MFITYEDRKNAHKMIELQISHYEDIRFNDFVFYGFSKITKKTRNKYLNKKELFNKKINNFAFYGLNKEFFFDTFITPKWITWTRKQTYLSYPLLLIYYAVWLYIHRITDQLQKDHTLEGFESFYWANIRNALKNDFKNKKYVLYRNIYKDFVTKTQNKIKEYADSKGVVIKLDTQNFFENIDMSILLTLMKNQCKTSILKKNSFNEETIKNILFFYNYISKWIWGIPQSYNNIISSYLSNLYMLFWDTIIYEELRDLKNKGIIAKYSCTRYVDDTYIFIDFSEEKTISDKTNITLKTLNNITNKFHSQLSLRFNSKCWVFDLSKNSDIEKLRLEIKNPSIEQSEEDSSIPDSWKPQIKVDNIIIVLKKIKWIGLHELANWLQNEDLETLKNIYDETTIQLLKKSDNNKKLKEVFKNFAPDLIKLAPKQIIYLMKSSQWTDFCLMGYINLLNDNLRKDYLLTLLLVHDEKNEKFYKSKIKESTNLRKIKDYFLFENYATFTDHYLYNSKSFFDNLLLKKEKHNLIQQIQLKFYCELTNDYWSAFNHLLNEFHLLCFILDSKEDNFEDYKCPKVILFLTSLTSPVTKKQENYIRNFFDTRNNSPLSHPWTIITSSTIITKEEYLKYQKKILIIISKNLTSLNF